MAHFLSIVEQVIILLTVTSLPGMVSGLLASATEWRKESDTT